MNKVVVYPNPEGGVCTLIPTPDALTHMTIEEIAAKDIPQGIKYKIIDANELPDQTFYNAWEYQE